MDLTEIWVVLFPSLTKSVTAPKWIRARLQIPFWQGPWGRSTTQEDRDRSAPSEPSSVPGTNRKMVSLTQWFTQLTSICTCLKPELEGVDLWYHLMMCVCLREYSPRAKKRVKECVSCNVDHYQVQGSVSWSHLYFLCWAAETERSVLQRTTTPPDTGQELCSRPPAHTASRPQIWRSLQASAVQNVDLQLEMKPLASGQTLIQRKTEMELFTRTSTVTYRNPCKEFLTFDWSTMKVWWIQEESRDGAVNLWRSKVDKDANSPYCPRFNRG